MYITLPKEVPIGPVVAFGGLVAAVQLIEGTSLIIAMLCFCFLLTSAIAFNLSGGLHYASGSFVASLCLLTAEIGIVAKAALGEPYERNLLAPEKTMSVYAVGMLTLLAAVWCNRLLRPRRALLESFSVSGNMVQIAAGCLVVAVVPPLILPSRYLGTFTQANYFSYLAIIIPVYETVRRSNGRKSFSKMPLLAWGVMTLNGLLSFSKQGMYTPSFIWVVACVGAGIHVSWKKLATLGAIGVVAFGVLTPFSQVGRSIGRGLGLRGSIDVAFTLLSHPLLIREYYLTQTLQANEEANSYHMFDEPEGSLDRLTMQPIDDALISVTDEGRKGSLDAIWSYFPNVIPRYIWKDKPTLAWGNTYAHDIGLLAPDDETTGISFSPFADGYHCGQWLGITAVAFPVFLICLFTMDAVGGSTQRTIWSLMFVVYAAHAAPEGMLLAPVYLSTTVPFFVFVAVFFSTRIVPLVGSLVVAPSRSSTATGVNRALELT